VEIPFGMLPVLGLKGSPKNPTTLAHDLLAVFPTTGTAI
jgi:hypothetical protein